MSEIFEGPEFEREPKAKVQREATVVDGELLSQREYEYDRSGRRILERGSYGSVEKPEGFYEIEYGYDQEGRLVRKTETQKDEPMEGSGEVTVTEYRYDSNGRKIEESSRFTNEIGDHDIHPARSRYYYYDQNNRPIREEEVYFDVEDYEAHSAEQVTYKYNSEGAYVRTVSSGTEKSVSIFNAEGQKETFESFDREGKLRFRTEYTNESGLPTKAKVVYDASGEVMNTKEFEYDQHDNIIRITTTYRDGKSLVEERRLEYTE